MDIYFTYEAATCNQFMREEKGGKESVDIVIAPLRVEGGETKLKVISGCNMWGNCRNPDCFYSAAAREKPRLQPSQK